MDPGLLAIKKPADQDLNCFQNRIYPHLAVSLVKLEEGNIKPMMHVPFPVETKSLMQSHLYITMMLLRLFRGWGVGG